MPSDRPNISREHVGYAYLHFILLLFVLFIVLNGLHNRHVQNSFALPGDYNTHITIV